MALNVITETPVLIAQVKDQLVKTKKKMGELNFRAQKALDHCEQFATIDTKQANELLDELRKLEVPRLRDQQLVKLVDVLPKTEAEVKGVLQGYAVTVTAENNKKIAVAISDFCAKL